MQNPNYSQQLAKPVARTPYSSQLQQGGAIPQGGAAQSTQTAIAINPNDPVEVGLASLTQLQNMPPDMQADVYKSVVAPALAKKGLNVPASIDPKQIDALKSAITSGAMVAPKYNNPSAPTPAQVSAPSLLGAKKTKVVTDQTKAVAQRELSQAGDSLAAADDLINNLNYDRFNIKNTVLAAKDNLLSNLGVASKEQTENAKEQAGQNAKMGNLFAQYVKSISGAAVSEQEFQRLRKSMINSSDSPAEAQAKAVIMYKNINVGTMAKAFLARNGVSSGQDTYASQFPTIQSKIMEDINRYTEAYKKAYPNANETDIIKQWRETRMKQGAYQ